MYLKEAFRYQNYLYGLLNQTLTYLGDNSITMRTTQEHLRGKVNPEAENETVDMTTERRIDCDANTLVKFAEYLLATKQELTAAIKKAKASADLDIDGETANNKMRQYAARVLSKMGGLRATERTRRGTDYKFNAEGNQVQYTYDVKEVSQIDFDRDVVKAVAKRLVNEADQVSINLDRVMVETQVDYTPSFSVNDSFEDAVEAFKSSLP